ncbi:hypothetical protein EVJ58_g7956 [Rhodofomes roseus]|uniref:DUF6535 domain-containing protein n=1 Tax=Rhodofomes roseus TaxID=34475 RepID=A0A4Y9Y2T9_9APHY|nr:hypothetical protein EVJ58_g7956 [Rhodofomes roseus]
MYLTREQTDSSTISADRRRHKKKSPDLSNLADKVWEREKERVERWRNEINSLLTFAGLFAAVITGFGVQYYTILQPPAPDYNTYVLELISAQLASLTNQSDVTSSQPSLASEISGSPAAPKYVAALWFAALVCGLAAASIAISVNQWLNNLLTPAGLSGSGPHERLRVWNLRHETFQKWRLGTLVDIPSVLLQIAVVLFLLGLIGYLWQLSHAVAIPAMVLVILLLSFLLITTIIPVFVAYSPFVTPRSTFLRWIATFTKLSVYFPTFQFFRWLWLNNAYAPIDDDFLRRMKTRFEARVDDLRALGNRGPYGSIAQESAYLRSEAGSEVDKTIIANVFFLVKDVSPLLSLIKEYLIEMPPHIASSNVLALCKRCDVTSIGQTTVRADEDSGDDATTQWQRDAPDKDILVAMGMAVADSCSTLGREPPNLELDDHLDALDSLLSATEEDEAGFAVYMRLFDLLADECLNDVETQKRILYLIWRYDNDFFVSTEDEMKRVEAARVTIYNKADLLVVFMFTALTFKIVTWLGDLQYKRALIQTTLSHFRDFLKNCLKTSQKHVSRDAISEMPWWSDGYMKTYPYTMLLFDNDPSVPSPIQADTPMLIVMSEVLQRLRLLVGEEEFEAYKILWAPRSFDDVLHEVNQRLQEVGQTIPTLEHEESDYAHRDEENVMRDDEDTATCRGASVERNASNSKLVTLHST